MVVMRDLQRDRLPKQYTLVDETELRTFQIRNEGEEILDTPLGRLRALRVSHSSPVTLGSPPFGSPPNCATCRCGLPSTRKAEVMRMEIRTVERQP
ncbi:MAG: hypothetical protein R3F44_20055 [Candidatus Competibacteraceae bacterium]